MAQRTADDHPRTETELAQEHGPTGHRRPAGRSNAGTVSVVLGAVAVAVGFIPLFGGFALILAAVGLAVAVPALGRAADADATRRARMGVALGIAAIVVGVLNLGIQLEWFDFFTAQ